MAPLSVARASPAPGQTKGAGLPVQGSAAADLPGVVGSVGDTRILADHIEVHRAVEKLRRRYGRSVEAIEGRAGCRPEAWPLRFSRGRNRQCDAGHHGT